MQESVEEDQAKNMEKSKQKFTKKKNKREEYFSTSRRLKTLEKYLKLRPKSKCIFVFQIRKED